MTVSCCFAIHGHAIIASLLSSLNKTRGAAFFGSTLFGFHVPRGIKLSQIPATPPPQSVSSQ